MNLLHTITELAKNPIFSGIAGVGFIGWLGYVCRTVPQWIFNRTRWLTTTTAYVRSDSASYEHLVNWMSQHLQQKWHVRSFNLNSVTDHTEAGEDEDAPVLAAIGDTPERKPSKAWRLSVGYGHFYFWWQGRPYWIDRDLLQKDTQRHTPLEYVHVRALGFTRASLDRLLQAAETSVIQDDSISIWQWLGHWKCIDTCKPRLLETVNLPLGMTAEIMHDIQRFQRDMASYRSKGIPYRRGYLFHGLPGTGKSSLAFALAGELGVPIYVMNLASVSNDNALFEAFSRVPNNAILLIEDIDATSNHITRTRQKFNGKEQEEETEDFNHGSSEVTLSGLLNVIDGVVAKEGRLLIMTTNHRERLDPALLRPGRVDREFGFGYATFEQAEAMLQRFFGAGALNAWTLEKTPAEIQGACQISESADEAIRRLQNGA